jgi:hypothetical protein
MVSAVVTWYLSMIPLGKTTLYFVEQLLPGYSKKSMTRRALSGGHQKNSTESLILAQDERWRRA